ncbi:MAG: class II aldolase/adducin family protein [Ruminococcaceae bacterium]|nr:class II aldolase/adducin family protein [Oscillospiraceae bacterium]
MKNIKELYKDEIKMLVQACHRCAELGYVTSSGGNLSVRVEENLILITPTKTPKRFMTEDDICAIDLEGNTVYAPEGKKPTGETPFHARIMRMRPDIKVIVHTHPPILTGFAIAHSDVLSKAILPEPIIEVGPVLNVKYATPLSEELSESFDKVITKSNAFLMENHGFLICGCDDVLNTVEQLQMVEAMAQSIVAAKCIGKVEFLSKTDLDELEEVIKVRSLKIPGLEQTSLKDIY